MTPLSDVEVLALFPKDKEPRVVLTAERLAFAVSYVDEGGSVRGVDAELRLKGLIDMLGQMDFELVDNIESGPMLYFIEHTLRDIRAQMVAHAEAGRYAFRVVDERPTEAGA